MRAAGAMLAAGALFLAPACGGQPASYAGMSKYEAVLEAIAAYKHEFDAPGSPLYRRRSTLTRVFMGRNGSGDHAWVATFRDDSTGTRFCVRLWVNNAVLVRTYNREFDDCSFERSP